MTAENTPLAQTIGDRIRRVREARGMSQSELARRAGGLTSQAINAIEGGQTKSPTPENLFFIADALETDARELVFGLKTSTLTRAQAIAKLLDTLPEQEAQKAFDFSFYTAERSAHLVAGEKLSSYNSMIETIRQDMDKKRPDKL